ncbi:hypothetical protein C0993_011978 [Termitomyces sp. T159_Od127]|nr:hypothetical protein C0993_011978 [Termitomyces sp. T159_Od127]
MVLVLQPNSAKRNVSNVENTPPSILPKSLTSRFFSHRRRARGNGQLSSNKYVAEQAVRRTRKQPPKQLKFSITVASPNPDVVMSDAPPLTSSSSSKTTSVTLPKQLGRPMYQEVTREALIACSSSFTEVPAAYLRDSFELIGPHALKSLASVRPQPFSPHKLPSEIEVKLECDDPLNPTHMLAIASGVAIPIILQHSTVVHGLWQNTCALGIFDDGLWEVIDVAWQILLAAVAVGTGTSIDLVLGEEEST